MKPHSKTYMSRTFARIILSATLLAVLGACSWFGEREPEYLESREGKPLQVPEGLDSPRQVTPVVIGVEAMPRPSGDQLEIQPPRVAVTAGGGEANAYMAWSSSGAYLAVKDTPESVARRLGFAIQRSGMNLLERHDDGSHRFEYRHTRIPQEKSFFQKLMFWRDAPGVDYSGTYRLRLQPDESETRVYLEMDNGERASTEAAEHVLGVFMDRLG